ncbi:MAG: hypothetical protein Q9195_006344 [Heterodermia aff. obscurata]
MAEALAVAASVIAVLQITNSVISICYDYSAAASGTSWQLPRLMSELESLRSVLQRLEPLAKQADFSLAVPNAKRPVFIELCKPNGPLPLCCHEIKSLEAVLKTPDWSAGFGPRRKAIIQALRWPLKEKDTEKALERISRLREILAFALIADQTAISLEIKKLSESINAAVLNSQQIVKSVENATLNLQEKISVSNDISLNVREQVKSVNTSSRNRDILNWLKAPDPSTNYRNACESRHAATGSWFLEGKEFSRWKIDATSMLWLHGKAGCGKTVLSSTVITELFRRCSHASGSSIAYFFFKFSDYDNQQSGQMIRSIVKQLSSQSSEAMVELESLFSSCQNGRQPADIASLIAILQAIIRKSEHLYIVLDALDECSDIVDLLAVVQKIVEGETVQNLTTSDRMIRIQSEVVDRDISNYISYRLQTDPLLKKRWRHRPDVQEEIRTALSEKADGMFRWAFCQINHLQTCRNLPTLREALRSLPKTLDETYSRILCNIPEEYSGYAVSILRWLSYAERPMRLAELGELIAVKLSGDPWLDTDIRFPDVRELLDIFPGLLQVDVNEIEDPIVSLAHFSVKEYLVSERIKTQPPQRFWLPQLQSHELIAATCLAYILYLDDERQLFINLDTSDVVLRGKYPLNSYACSNWTRHARFVDSHQDSHQGILKDFILEFLQRDDIRRLWFRGFYVHPLLNTRMYELKYIPPLFIAASIGVRGTVKILLESGHQVNERCYLGTALETAAAQGHSFVLRSLLENGADPNLLGRDNLPPLHVAAQSRAIESVKALVEFGAEMHDERGIFGSPLIAACVSCDYLSADFLLDKGANIHTLSGKYGTALHAACAHSRGNIELIKKLVSMGAEIDARGGKYGTALQAACAHSQNDQVINFLLSLADPCIEVEESKYGTALQAVCAESHDNDKIVKLLLDHDAKKTARGGKYGTILHAACYQGNERIVQLLLGDQYPEKGTTADQNLDVNEVTTRYGTLLHAAYLGREERMVCLLLKLGANVNTNVPELGTPLHLACIKGQNPKLVKLLLDKGADVNIRRDTEPYTALEILLQHENLRDNQIKLRMLYEQSVVVEAGISPTNLTRLEKLKKQLGLPDRRRGESEKEHRLINNNLTRLSRRKKMIVEDSDDGVEDLLIWVFSEMAGTIEIELLIFYDALYDERETLPREVRD